jgi:hypothetical protein
VKVGEATGTKAYITNDKRLPIEFTVGVIPSVHCVGLSDIWEACQYVVSGQTVGVPGKLKFIDSVITLSASQCYATKCYRSFFVYCSVLCLYGSCEIQFRTKSFRL